MTSDARKPSTAGRTALAASGLVIAVLVYLGGLFVGMFGFSPNSDCGSFTCAGNALGTGSLILLGVLAIAIAGTVLLSRVHRLFWLVPILAIVVIWVGWIVTFSAAGFTAYGV